MTLPRPLRLPRPHMQSQPCGPTSPATRSGAKMTAAARSATLPAACTRIRLSLPTSANCGQRSATPPPSPRQPGAGRRPGSVPVRPRHTASGPGVRLLAGFQRSLSGRPQGCAGGCLLSPAGRGRRAGEPGVPRPRCAVPGRAARGAPVPGHRPGPARAGRHARRRPGHRPPVPHRVRGQRPGGAGARPRTAHQHPRGEMRLPRRRRARPRGNPESRSPAPGLHPAHGHHPGRCPPFPGRLRQPSRRPWPRWPPRWRQAASWRSPT